MLMAGWAVNVVRNLVPVLLILKLIIEKIISQNQGFAPGVFLMWVTRKRIDMMVDMMAEHACW